MGSAKKIKIFGEKRMSRIKDKICKIGEIGRTAQGISRICFSEAYFCAVRECGELMKQAGLQTRVDTVGNIVGRKEGSDPECRTIMLGSHLDTVQNGGLFDGNAGVMMAIECMERMKDTGYVPKHTFEVWGFNAEESSPLGGTFGSRAIMGLIDVDRAGFPEILEKYHLRKEDIENAKIDPAGYYAYLEAHIEQGDFLYQTGKKIGVVTGIVGICRYTVHITGVSNHAGTTRMSTRKDALVAAAKLIVWVNERAKAYGDGFVATVGTIQVSPGVASVIPGDAVFQLETRSLDMERCKAFMEEFIMETHSLKNVQIDVQEDINKASMACDRRLMEVLAGECVTKGVSYSMMPSGAGHDANAIAHRIPAAMMFLPSKDGISHSINEWTEWNDIEIGTDLLYDALLRLDQL